MPKLTTPDGTPWPSITLTLDNGTPLALDADALARLVQHDGAEPIELSIDARVARAVGQISKVVAAPLSPGQGMAINAIVAAILPRRTPAVLGVAPLVRNTVERIGEIAPLSPMAKLEIDAVLTALCDEVAARAEVHAEQERVARRDLGGDYDFEGHSGNLRGLTGSH